MWSMLKTHPFTFGIEPDLLRELRYRWTVCEGSQIHVRSPHSYATKPEAEREAAKAVVRREKHWRNGECDQAAQSLEVEAVGQQMDDG